MFVSDFLLFSINAVIQWRSYWWTSSGGTTSAFWQQTSHSAPQFSQFTWPELMMLVVAVPLPWQHGLLPALSCCILYSSPASSEHSLRRWLMLSGVWPHILRSGIEAFQPALCAVACALQIARVVSTEISISPLDARSKVRCLLGANFSFKISCNCYSN